MDAFVESGGSRAVMEINNFSLLEFDDAWRIIKRRVRAQYERGQGRKSVSKLNGFLFMFLSALKHAGNWDSNRLMLVIKGPIFESVFIGFSN